jgi:hypothetical protein
MTPEQAKKILKVVPVGSPYYQMAVRALQKPPEGLSGGLPVGLDGPGPSRPF